MTVLTALTAESSKLRVSSNVPFSSFAPQQLLYYKKLHFCLISHLDRKFSSHNSASVCASMWVFVGQKRQATLFLEPSAFNKLNKHLIGFHFIFMSIIRVYFLISQELGSPCLIKP